MEVEWHEHADVARLSLVQHLDEIVYRFQVGQIVIVHIDTDAEVQSGVTTIDNFEVSKLNG